MSSVSIAHSSTRGQECGRMLPLGVCRPRLGCLFVVIDPPEANATPLCFCRGALSWAQEWRGLPAAPRVGKEHGLHSQAGEV